MHFRNVFLLFLLTLPFLLKAVLNAGTASIDLPVAPHLSDLQPNDESVAFNYFSVALVVRGEAEPQGAPVDSIGFVELFGSPDRAESMMVLRPGEWIRVTANVKLLKCPSAPVSARFRGDFGCAVIGSVRIQVVSSSNQRIYTRTPRPLPSWQSVYFLPRGPTRQSSSLWPYISVTTDTCPHGGVCELLDGSGCHG
jgi:hypothetical protein